jgi:hypothetical protein
MQTSAGQLVDGPHAAAGQCCSCCVHPQLRALLSVQVLLFNLLPPPGSSPMQPDVPGEAWVPTAEAQEVQAAVVDAIEQVRTVLVTVCCVLFVLTRRRHQSGWAFFELVA